jgi:preprotein translocase subunit SecG
MSLVLLIIHLVVCMSLIGLVLLQRSEGGALGMGGGGGGAGSLMTGRGAADALARMTSVAGGFFLVTSLGLTVLSGAAASADGRSVFDLLPQREIVAPAAPAPAPTPTDADRPDPTESSVPVDTRLASAIAPGPVEAAAAPPATDASTRARPLAPAQTQTVVPTSAQRGGAAAVPASSGAAPVRPATPPPATQRSATGTTPAATGGGQTPTRTLVLPNTSGSGTAPDAAQIEPESVEVVEGVDAVRRERAGPDQ